MPEVIIDVIVPTAPVVEVAAIGVQGPPGTPGAPGPAGPPGPQGPAGTAGIHAATHYVGGSDALAGSLAATDVRVGVNPAQSGAVRLANNGQINARNSANTADVNIMQVTTNAVYAGASGFGLILQGSYLDVSSQLYVGPTGYVTFDERTAPAVPSPNRVNLWCEDNGAGKTRLMARFATGAAVQIAIEP